MDARSLEVLRSAQRIVDVVERHTDLHRLASESKAFELFKLAIAELEEWEPLKVPSRNQHVEQILAEASGFVSFASGYLDELIDSGMHPSKLEQVETEREELKEAYTRWVDADSYSAVFPDWLVRLKKHLRKRERQLKLELWSSMSREARAEWRLAAALGRKHRSNALPSGDAALPAALPASPEVKLLPGT